MRAGSRSKQFRSSRSRSHGVADQRCEAGPPERFARSAQEMSARRELFPLLTKSQRNGEIVNRGSFTAMIAAVSTGYALVKIARFFVRHLFSTESKFIAALDTSIQEANSAGGTVSSRLLSPTDSSFSANPRSCA